MAVQRQRVAIANYLRDTVRDDIRVAAACHVVLAGAQMGEMRDITGQYLDRY